MSDDGDARLDAAIRGLPREIDPPDGLWAEIDAQIGRSSRRRWWPAAAAIAAAVLAGALWLGGRGSADPAPPGDRSARSASSPTAGAETEPFADPPPAPTVSVELIPAEEELRAANEVLTEAYQTRRRVLDRELVAVFDESIGVVDDAIQRSRAALADTPGDDHLRQVLDRAYRHKLALLRRAASTEPSP